jgi:uncharacterized protein YndB with AHSA1/START domain
VTLSRALLVTEQRHVRAEPQRLFDIVADPARHPELDGSGSVRAAQAGNPARLALGARFSMDMKVGAAYRVTNTVVEFEEGRRIAWHHLNGHIWRYLFDADGDGAGDGTTVTEQWDARPAHIRLPLLILGFPARNRAGMRATLAQLERLATA